MIRNDAEMKTEIHELCIFAANIQNMTDMTDVMKNRRTIRKYANRNVPETLLNELLEIATRASNTGNSNYTV